MEPSGSTRRMTFIEAFMNKFALEGIGVEGLEAFVKRRIPEGLNLEYKAKDILHKPNDAARVVASFANSDGGLLIVGVAEVKDGSMRYPGSITWDPEPSHSPEWMETMVAGRIRPRIQGVRIVPVHKEGAGVVYIIDVPASPNPPHMAPDGIYYYRSNFHVLPMEHYQVADAFGKRRRPILRPLLTVSQFNADDRTLLLKAGLVNEGLTLAKWTMIHLSIVGCVPEKKDGVSLWEDVRTQRGA